LLAEVDPFRLLSEDFETLLDRMADRFSTILPELRKGPASWGVTFEQKEKEVVIRVEAPGFEPKDLSVELLGELLMIKAKRVEKPEKVEGKEPAEERSLELERTLSLPEGVDIEKIEVFYRNGIVEVHLPRLPGAEPRRIEIKP